MCIHAARGADNSESGALCGVGEKSFLRIAGCADIAAWVWALTAFHDRPVLLGTAFLAWSLGLRHAVDDADHIAAIDNVTRKLVQAGRPVAQRRPVLRARSFGGGRARVALLALAVAALEQ